ncbi:sugar ABC transporter substrate-binding protein [Paenibacillus sp. Soil766]|uniref:ABC transporter substrate-binding protein n=1 Tax=Paenibacillus sp. Soil766 TaxID=1736404 RepID=UPI00070DEE63|nr:ABC transporter substrate-binding protein [Paenibacillus sp. Soil766]KRE83888.1 sugar ABC transporter substrate-binding protein [Paenibacillus sp. Soil766]
MKKAVVTLMSLSMIFTATACSSGTSSNQSGGATTAPTTATTPSATVSASKEPVKLRMAWWGGQARHDYTLKVIEMYEKAHPNVKIEAEYAAFDDYWKKLAPQAAANQLPDIIQMDISYLTQYGGRNQLADLTTFTKSKVLNVDDVSPNALSGGQVGGKLVAMNLGVNALTSMMDFEMLKKAGIATPEKNWTWSDMDAMATKAKAAGKIMGGFRDDVFFPYYLRTLGQKMYNAEGTALGYTDDKMFIDYFNRIQKWYDAGVLLPLDKAAQKKGTPEDDEMTLGNSISSNGWSNQYIGLANAAKRDLVLQPMPGPDANKGLFLKPSMYWSVSSSSKAQEEAAKFIDFWINDIEANKIIKGERGVPVASKVKEALKPLLSPNEIKVFDYVAWAEKNSSPMDPPNPVGSIEIEKLLKDTGEKILYKKITVQEAAAAFRKDATVILEKNKK